MNFASQLKRSCKLTTLVLGISGILICTASANTAVKGDDFYQQENFEEALTAYTEAAEMGSPHVYYQLGTIYYKGLGTKPNYLSAVLWFSLAAEYQFSDSKKVLKQLLKNIDVKERANVRSHIKDFKAKYGKKIITETYLPKLITANLNKRVSFGGPGRDASGNEEADKLFGIESTASLSEFELDDDFDDSFDNSFGNSVDEFSTLGQDAFNSDPFGDIQGSMPQKRSPLNLPFLAVIDYEVAADGSIRNMTKEYTKGRKGNIDTAMYNYSLYTLPQPTFEGERISFFHRQYLGLTKWKIGRIRANHKDLYDWARRENKKLIKQNTSQSQYKRAMLLTYYPWFPQEKGLAASLLKNSAEEGYAYAQYEYGLHLYRRQIDPVEGIKWLSLASQFGLPKAQYALARILQVSPWVAVEETKSLYWYEKAAKNDYSKASIKLAELKLLASDESLRDQAAAVNILEGIEREQSSNPDYSYLVAISHLKGEYRDFPKVITYMRKAISRGHTLNWDVSKWEEQLSRWTTGSVTIRD